MPKYISKKSCKKLGSFEKNIMKSKIFVLVFMLIVFSNLSFSQGLYLYSKAGYSTSNFTSENYELN